MDITDWYVLALLGSVVATLLAAWATWRNREQAGAVPLVWLLVGAALWSGCDLATQLSASPELDLLLNKALYAGMVVVVNGYVLFGLEFIGRGDLLTRRTVAALAIEPGLLLGLLVYDPTGGALVREMVGSGGVATAGPAFLAHAAYSYLLVAVTTGLLFRTALQTRGLYVWQFAALLTGVFVPIFANALYLFDFLTVDVTPLAFSVTGVALFMSIRWAGFMDVVPVARDMVVDTIDDAMVVVDQQGRIIDYNTAFEPVIDGDSPAIGTLIDSILGDYPALQAAIEADADGAIVGVSTPAGKRDFEVTVSAVEDQRGDRLGRVVLLHDVTERERQRRELERQNEQLDQFASIISHDLRNPLNVAAGRTSLAKETGDLSHLEDVEDAHERMHQLIDDVLDLARHGRDLDETTPVALTDVATQAWAHVDTGEATLETDANVTIVADEGRLRQVFENLFRNAVEHASPAAELADAVGRTTRSVTVRVGSTDDGYYVADDGPGIPEDERDAVFDAGHTSADDGTGFGLAIVDEIAQAHGWNVRITESWAGGARFEFSNVERVREQMPA
ncbi:MULTISPECIES: histidine kinase N-terminal 7TM domain-containing protein [Salinibaculum]|uniref:sensor histidine kinase n=1 Tax=Salinibaculum TaxID=2732368 RepID=UPI0030CF408F